MRTLPPTRRTPQGITFCGTYTLFTLLFVVGCGSVTSSSTPTPTPTPPPPTPASITVTVSPESATVLLGDTQPFSASVSNTSDTGVRWTLSGSACPNFCGALDANGNYTAPAILPALTTVIVAAQSIADPSKQASAIITIASDITVALSPNPASVELGAIQPFHASISSAGQPNTSVRWALAGASCPVACGSLDSSGNFTAPPILPNSPNVTVTAQSVADPLKEISANITIASNFTLQISAPSTLASGGSATVAATLTPIPGSNPSTALSWSLSGAGCSASGCGSLGVITTQALGGGGMSATANYTAPVTPPTPNIVTIAVIPQADPTKRALATIAIQPGVGVTLSPGTATLSGLHRVTLTAQIFGSSNTAVIWTVNGINNGNGTVGQVCIVASTPCQPLASGGNVQVDYQAPGAIPSPNPVTVRATSVADPTRSATAQITIINHDVVSVFPSSVSLAPLAVQSFSATVLGAGNQSVFWQLQGPACSVPGACGAIDSNGVYTAPGSAPSPDSLTVVAISSDDPAQSGSASVTISTGAAILALHPASVYAGGANGLTLRVDGSNFIGTSPGPGSILLIAGTVRTTTCTSVTECTAPVSPADVAATGAVPIQVRNPDNSTSNIVSLIVAAPNSADASVPLSTSAPTASAQDITVVEPTTAGVSSPSSDIDLNVAALGLFSVANNSCSLAGNPIPLLRPASGSSATDICLFSASGLDSSMTYTITGTGDVAVIAKQPAGLGIIHLTLQVSAVALPGSRSLFIQNANLDKTAATGALEVQ